LSRYHFYWVGEYSDTFFCDKGEKGLLDRAGVKCPSWADNDLNNKKSKAGGICIMTDLAGDTAYATYQGTGTSARTNGAWEWTGGTGKYKEIKGSNTYDGTPL
jgi:hypothetical protein